MTVTAVTVTYGDRAVLCRRAVEAAFDAGATDAVVVLNGVVPAAFETLMQWVATDPRISPEVLARNEGSAAGFARGIAVAAAAGSDFVWLLDDDNEPDAAALKALLIEERRHEKRRETFVYLSLRADRPHLRALADGASPSSVFPARSSFLNFNVVDFAHPRRWRRSTRQAAGCVEGLPYAPFGGLFLPAAVLARCAPPDRNLVLYEDDTDFTHRLTSDGVRIVLVCGSIIRDQAGSWYEDSAGRGPEKLVTARSDARVYYSVRNRVYFETSSWQRSRALYICNKLAYLTILAAYAIRRRGFSRFVLILQAVRDGERGRLGALYELGDVG
jgi:GT2 family glycosyltransferase